MKDQKGIAHILPLVLVSFLILIGGWWLWKNNSLNIEVENPTSTPDSSEMSNKDGLSDWETYTNEELGFSFKHPADYSLTERDGAVQISHQTAVFLTIRPLDENDYNTYEVCSEAPEETCLLESNPQGALYKDTLVDGKRAKSYYLTGAGPDNDYHNVQTVEEPLIGFSAYLGDLQHSKENAEEQDEIFNQILSSFEFTGTNVRESCGEGYYFYEDEYISVCYPEALTSSDYKLLEEAETYEVIFSDEADNLELKIRNQFNIGWPSGVYCITEEEVGIGHYEGTVFSIAPKDSCEDVYQYVFSFSPESDISQWGVVYQSLSRQKVDSEIHRDVIESLTIKK